MYQGRLPRSPPFGLACARSHPCPQEVPDLFDRAVCHRDGDLTGPELEMCKSTADELEEDADIQAVAGIGVRLSGEPLGLDDAPSVSRAVPPGAVELTLPGDRSQDASSAQPRTFRLQSAQESCPAPTPDHAERPGARRSVCTPRVRHRLDIGVDSRRGVLGRARAPLCHAHRPQRLTRRTGGPSASASLSPRSSAHASLYKLHNFSSSTTAEALAPDSHIVQRSAQPRKRGRPKAAPRVCGCTRNRAHCGWTVATALPVLWG
jgi:hypothetical protein